MEALAADIFLHVISIQMNDKRNKVHGMNDKGQSSCKAYL